MQDAVSTQSHSFVPASANVNKEICRPAHLPPRRHVGKSEEEARKEQECDGVHRQQRVGHVLWGKRE
jgi:hypothetical protein